MAPRNRRSLSPSPQTVKLSINSVLCASLLLLLVTVPGISCFSNEKPSSSDSSLSSQTPSPVKSDGDGSVESAQLGGTARSRAQGQKADKRKEGGYLSLGRKQTPVRPSNICSNRSCTTQENINCQVTKRSQYCMHRDESALDHPNSPRDLKIQQKQVGNYTYFNVTWQAPYDCEFFLYVNNIRYRCMHSPRDLKIMQKQVGNYTYFNVTWQAPYDSEFGL
ncbi:hypothetical protein V1264_020100 [Littorina saxatilis]|uniref:Uncharacterized protein n=1 Tax=Littorina saxatilis TaxID=31220 RepID=A0AAN9BE59_9CAEN